jgi:hypothetical protein
MPPPFTILISKPYKINYINWQNRRSKIRLKDYVVFLTLITCNEKRLVRLCEVLIVSKFCQRVFVIKWSVDIYISHSHKYYSVGIIITVMSWVNALSLVILAFAALQVCCFFMSYLYICLRK